MTSDVGGGRLGPQGAPSGGAAPDDGPVDRPAADTRSGAETPPGPEARARPAGPSRRPPGAHWSRRRAVQRLAYAAAAPFIHGFARLPLAVLYRISDAACFVLRRVLRYRRRVIRENLRRSFPRLSAPERERIERDFYRHLCDLGVETLKMLVMDAAEIQRRMPAHGLELLDQYAAQDQSVVLVLGHCANWEWAIPVVECGASLRLDVVYHPVRNPYFDALFRHARGRFGSHLTSMQEAPRRLIRRRDECTAMVFVADQFPRSPRPYRTRFLEQDTAFIRGPERIARRLDAPVIFVDLVRRGRGRYALTLELLCEHPARAADGEVTERFARRLEETIRSAPGSWLWSHRRWKDAGRPDASQTQATA